MKERAISFNADMIRAILDGKKTQTRRIMRPQPDPRWRYNGERFEEYHGYPVGHDVVPCPYGEIGDRLTNAGMDAVLEITDVRTERLQNISEEDARAEGVMQHVVLSPSPVTLFCVLWGHIYGPGSWDANPYVWVIEFRKASEGKL